LGATSRAIPLFWLVNEIDGKRRIFIQEAGAMMFAKIKASTAGFEGEPVEAYALDKARPGRCRKR